MESVLNKYMNAHEQKPCMRAYMSLLGRKKTKCILYVHAKASLGFPRIYV